jgi:hypothetical protein
MQTRAFILSLLATALFAAQDGALKPIRYTPEGNVPIPEYSRWVHISSFLTNAGAAARNPRFSIVYAEPSAWDYFMKKGSWPDRTVILSEKRGSASTLGATSSAGWAAGGDLLGAEMEIKDASKGGWTFYEVERGATFGTPLPRSQDCYTCHPAKAAVDNTFVQFYPELREAAKRAGTLKEAAR